MDLQALRDAHVADALLEAIERSYSTALSARTALLLAVEADKVTGKDEVSLVTYLRWEFFRAIKEGAPLTLGELALGGALYSVHAKNVTFEISCAEEENLQNDPYNQLPALCLARFATIQNPDERLLLVGVIDGILGVWIEDLEFGNTLLDDYTHSTVLRHDTVEKLGMALRANQDVLAYIQNDDLAARSVTPDLERFLLEPGEWEPFFRGALHRSEFDRLNMSF